MNADTVERLKVLLKNEEFPREALECAGVGEDGTVRIVLRALNTSRSYVATFKLLALEEV